MEIYLVGGAVRDQLLGLPVKERDWVVVGASPQVLLDLGYQPVGKDFPVFLHPETHEEYALARTERKVAKGYKGFQFHADAAVTLEEDLKRRDLTINAIAETPEGALIDPYGGVQDIEGKILRHVSPAFAEDPVRILRLARFASKLPDFSVCEDTTVLMQEMVRAGEVDALVAERVWQEWARALGEKAPLRFFEVLRDCDALSVLFPEIIVELDIASAALARVSEGTDNSMIRFAVLLHCLGSDSIRTLCQRYRVPREYKELAVLTAESLPMFAQASIDPEDKLAFLKRNDALRRAERFQLILASCQWCFDRDLSSHVVAWNQRVEKVKSLDISVLREQNLSGPEFAEALKTLQLAALADV